VRKRFLHDRLQGDVLIDVHAGGGAAPEWSDNSEFAPFSGFTQ